MKPSQLDYNIYPEFQALETIFIKEASDLLVGAAISQFKTIGFKISNEFNNYHRTQVHVLSENQIKLKAMGVARTIDVLSLQIRKQQKTVVLA